MEAVEEGEDTNHIMVLPSNGGSNPAPGEQGGGGEQGAEKPGFQRPKPRMQVEIRQAKSIISSLAKYHEFSSGRLQKSRWRRSTWERPTWSETMDIYQRYFSIFALYLLAIYENTFCICIVVLSTRQWHSRVILLISACRPPGRRGWVADEVWTFSSSPPWKTCWGDWPVCLWKGWHHHHHAHAEKSVKTLIRESLSFIFVLICTYRTCWGLR